MIKDNKYREELSIKAREYAVQNYSHKAHVKTWLKILGTF